MYKMNYRIFAQAIIIIFYSINTSSTGWKREIQRRNELLRSIALSSPKNCNGTKVVYIRNAYGRTGNYWISIANALWVTSVLQGSFNVPDWAAGHLFDHFVLDIFKESFCTTYDVNIRDSRRRNPIGLLGGESFNIFRLYNNTNLKPLLPPLDENTLREVTHFYVRFLASLWGSPKPEILRAGIATIQFHLGNNLDYVSVHQRSHEGICNRLYCSFTNTSNFSPLDLPLLSKEWLHVQQMERTMDENLPRNCSAFEEYHNPLCRIRANTVRNILEHSNRNRTPAGLDVNLHLGTDSRNQSNELVSSLGAVIPQYHINHTVDHTILDMFLFIHSGLFIQNPMSTLSTTACIVRQILGLRTVPMLNTSQMSIEERTRPGWWITCDLVADYSKFPPSSYSKIISL